MAAFEVLPVNPDVKDWQLQKARAMAVQPLALPAPEPEPPPPSPKPQKRRSALDRIYDEW